MTESKFSDNHEMNVTKRNGTIETVSFDKILNRIKKIGQEVEIQLNYTNLAMKVIDQLYDKISTSKIDELSSEQCASMASIHPDYNILAGRIAISSHHKNTKESFTETMMMLYNYRDKHDKHCPLISEDLYNVIMKHGEELDKVCDYSRDYLIDYFGFKTLERAYLMKVNRVIVERPQHMWMRVSIGIHSNNIEKVRETYHLMSQKYFTHATPTLFNSGTPKQQLSSCYLISLEEDSIDGIYSTLKDCALISKWAGGIGLHIHNVRASGSHIRGTNGTSNGIVPMLRVFNNTARYVDQCVHPSTIIYTTHGPKEIQDCVIDETYIYNSSGYCEKIYNVLEHSYSGEMLTIHDESCIKPLEISPEHPICIIPKGKSPEVENMEWIDAKDIQEYDKIVYPIPKYDADINYISEDDCYIYGILLTYGYFQFSNDTNYDKFVFDTSKNETIIDYVKEYLSKRYIQYDVSINNIITTITWKRSIELPFRYSDMYNEKKERHIHHRWLNLPISKSKYILKALLENGNENNGQIFFYESCYHFAEAIRFLCLRFGILVDGFVNKETETYIVNVTKSKEICNLINAPYYNNNPINNQNKIGNSFLLANVISISNSTYNGIVYDLQMKEYHNYLISNGLVHNGGGRRNGSFAIYLEPWHADIELFLQMRKNHGDEELKARDLFYALWVPDLFMERVKGGKEWTLMCPDECPGLSDVYGDEFVKLYESYEKAGKGRKSINARELWFQILDAQMETGTPYILYKDAANTKSNQKNLGTIKSSNLCVAPETLILTEDGHIEIKSLEGQEINVWNGEEFSKVKIFKTGENQELIDVYTNDGCKLTCTKYHKFFIQNGEEIEVKEAKDLKENDKIIKCNYPVIDGKESIDSSQIKNKDYSPINYSIASKMGWFSGICESAGSTIEIDSNTLLQLKSENKEWLIKIKLILQTCGVNPFLESTNYYHILTIESSDLLKLINLGFQPENLIKYIKINPKYQANKQFIKITKIEDNGRIDDTYCFTEPKKNAGIFNGIITSQCTEIIEYSDSKETSVCNLASIALPSLLEMQSDNNYLFNYGKLHKIAKVVTHNLNRIIDVNFYPTEKTHKSNFRHRPIGIGVQGLADVFMMMNIPFTADEAKKINRDIFETIYHAALEESCDMAIKYGPYETFQGSPASKGILQFDMWGVDPGSERYNWNELKERIKKHGIRNSLLLAPMPTASTSQILGFNECIEPITSNIYSRRTLAGEFIMANKYLMNDLIRLNLWNEKIKNNIIANNGSIQQIDIIPEEIREKYKTVWEIPMRHLIDMSADRGAFICQSQSLNLWLEDPNYNTLTSMHFYGWSKGLKTGIYYLRRRGRHQAQQFTIEVEKKQDNNHIEEDEICEMCSA
jgi:ribonucleoside-diphosphate reductase alpha chain